ncbi:hypothetical protein GJ496_004386 [Pomphorhynchus laevis]|nr:hypothetical protein GJ496_004386 [Pomphorhynchus laevis]
MEPKGIVKNYLRYKLDNYFGGVTGTRANTIFVPDRFLITCCCEFANVYDIKLERIISQYRPTSKAQITRIIELNSNELQVAIAYSDGSLYICSKTLSSVQLTGHRLSIGALAFQSDLKILASGSADRDIVIWDIIDQRGLCKLRGHKDAVTHLEFMKSSQVLISSSKDRTIRFWDTELQHCFQTICPSTEEIMTFKLMFDDMIAISGSLQFQLYHCKSIHRDMNDSDLIDTQQNTTITDSMARFNMILLGSVPASSSNRITELIASDSIFAVHGNDRNLDIYQIRSSNEIKNRLNFNIDANSRSPKVEDIIKKMCTIQAKSKIQSVCIPNLCNGKILISTKSNSVEIHDQNTQTKSSEMKFTLSTEISGHRTCKKIDVSSDETMIAMTDDTNVRIWNRNLGQNFRTISCDDHLTSIAFLPNNHYITAGSKNGTLFTINLVSKTVIDCKKNAHENAISQIFIYPNKIGFSTCSLDGVVNLWTFKSDQNQLFELDRTESVGDGCTTNVISHNGELAACALLDCTIKVLFFDSFKLHLLLYGHTAPVQCLDISFDDELLISGSADRTIRIWGLRFGDCHKSLLYHENSINSIHFLPFSHHFVAASQDNKVSRWDADSFERIQTLEDGHFASVVDVAVTKNFILSASLDRTIRCWYLSEEILVTQLERQKERDALLEAESQRSKDDVLIPGQPQGESSLLLYKTSNCLTLADLIIDSLESLKESESEGNPLSDESIKALMTRLKRIKASDLYSVLVHISIKLLPTLTAVVEHNLERDRNIELCAKIVAFLVRLRLNQIINNEAMKMHLKRISQLFKQKMDTASNVLEFNESALLMLTNNSKFRLKADKPKGKKRKGMRIR